jgi:DNA-binding LacI/PurR family transcriptional regulator
VANLKDVARLAGVDPSTVSRVLRNEWADVVRPETRDRIVNAAAELGYRPNAAAKGLRTKRTNTLGLVVPDLDNLGFADVSHGVQAAAVEAGYLVLLADGRVVEQEQELLERLVFEGRIDGLLLAYAQREDRFVAQLSQHEVPVVLVNRRSEGAPGFVIVNDHLAAELAVRHLHDLGHRSIAFIGGPLAFDTGRRRDAGYHEALANLQLPLREEWIADGEYTELGGYAAALRILDARPSDGPTAIFAANLMSGLGALRAIRKRGLRVPEDISLVAMDEHVIAEHTNPPMTTIATPLYQMGVAAVTMLIDAIEGRQPVRNLMIDEAPRLVRRASSAAPPNGSAGG